MFDPKLPGAGEVDYKYTPWKIVKGKVDDTHFTMYTACVCLFWWVVFYVYP